MMGRFHDYEDEFARADASERELQRQMGMQDGPSSKSSTFDYNRQNNYGGYNTFNNNYNNNFSAPPQQQSVWNGVNQSTFINRIGGGRQRQISNPRAAKLAMTVLAVIFFIVSLFLLAVMYVTVKVMRDGYDKCTLEVEAVVVQNVLSSTGSNKGSSYYPVFRYEYDGKVYQQKSSSGRKPAKYEIGDKVTLHINPDKPMQFYDEKEDKLVMIIISSIAGFFFVIALIFTALSISKKKQIQSMME